MAQQFFEELSRCLRKEQIESYNKEDRRLEIFLHGQPVLSVSPGNEVFLLPAGSKNPEANELYPDAHADGTDHLGCLCGCVVCQYSRSHQIDSAHRIQEVTLWSFY